MFAGLYLVLVFALPCVAHAVESWGLTLESTEQFTEECDLLISRLVDDEWSAEDVLDMFRPGLVVLVSALYMMSRSGTVRRLRRFSLC